jgi:Cft2 family RNA processing exonuclease
VQAAKEWKFRGLSVLEVPRSQHHSKNYFKIRKTMDSPTQQLPLEDALAFLLDSENIPLAERNAIEGFTVFIEDAMICLHCGWAPTIFQQKEQIFQELGWYPYVTGRILKESKVSSKTDAWLETRNFNALEFPNFPVTKIELESVAASEGVAFLLKFNDFKILLDCCIDFHDPKKCDLPETPDLVFISHAHNDHLASLDHFTTLYDGIPIIMSHTTLDLISYFKHSSKLRRYLKQNAYPLLFDDVYSINDAISLQILRAGHYPGAAMLYIFTMQHKILFTGDLYLHDLQPLKGSESGIQNLNGPLDTLILDAQHCNRYITSQKLLLDKACEKAIQTLQNGGPVLVIGDPGSWISIFYLKFFYYLTQLNKKYRIYLDSHSIEIMKILRHRHEDITPFLQQRILRFHDPFASIMRQDLEKFDFANHSIDDPPIILFNAREYTDPPPPFLTPIFEDPKALLIITFPIRSEPLRHLWTSLTYNTASPKPLQCMVLGRRADLQDPKFSLHIDKSQIQEIMRHLQPPHLFLFHNMPIILAEFKNYFLTHLSHLYPNTTVEILEPLSQFTLYDASLTSPPSIETDDYFFPLIKTLELALAAGQTEVNLSSLSQLLTSKFPYWKENLGISKLSDYITAATTAKVVTSRQERSETLVKLK